MGQSSVGSPVSPKLSNLYMEEVESRALTGTTPSHWFRYVDDTRVKLSTREVEAFKEHMNAVDNNIKFTRGDVRADCLHFLDCAVHTEEALTLRCTKTLQTQCNA